MYLFLCFLRVYSMCEGLRSPLLSADFLSFPLLSSPLLASPLPRHLPILSFSATNPSFHSAALLYTPSAARHYTPSAALQNTGTTLLRRPAPFPPKLIQTPRLCTRLHLIFSQFCMRLHLSFSRFCMRSLSASSIRSSVQRTYLTPFSPGNSAFQTLSQKNELSVHPNVQDWRSEQYPRPGAFWLTLCRLFPPSIDFRTVYLGRAVFLWRLVHR